VRLTDSYGGNAVKLGGWERACGFRAARWLAVTAVALATAALAVMAVPGAAGAAAAAASPLPPLSAQALALAIGGLPSSQQAAAVVAVTGRSGSWSGTSGVADLTTGGPATAADEVRIGSISRWPAPRCPPPTCTATTSRDPHRPGRLRPAASHRMTPGARTGASSLSPASPSQLKVDDYLLHRLAGCAPASLRFTPPLRHQGVPRMRSQLSGKLIRVLHRWTLAPASFYFCQVSADETGRALLASYSSNLTRRTSLIGINPQEGTAVTLPVKADYVHDGVGAAW
jgi:hypothetical protein